ncbi:MAG TPA: hypothetical protein VK901_17135, partial [Nitrospiraceae bacterium]|nr:hypothetical protein [Nitrospiraceae bacterium]
VQVEDGNDTTLTRTNLADVVRVIERQSGSLAVNEIVHCFQDQHEIQVGEHIIRKAGSLAHSGQHRGQGGAIQDGTKYKVGLSASRGDDELSSCPRPDQHRSACWPYDPHTAGAKD